MPDLTYSKPFPGFRSFFNIIRIKMRYEVTVRRASQQGSARALACSSTAPRGQTDARHRAQIEDNDAQAVDADVNQKHIGQTTLSPPLTH
jgi:hypothetical protein